MPEIRDGIIIDWNLGIITEMSRFKRAAQDSPAFLLWIRITPNDPIVFPDNIPNGVNEYGTFDYQDGLTWEFFHSRIPDGGLLFAVPIQPTEKILPDVYTHLIKQMLGKIGGTIAVYRLAGEDLIVMFENIPGTPQQFFKSGPTEYMLELVEYLKNQAKE